MCCEPSAGAVHEAVTDSPSVRVPLTSEVAPKIVQSAWNEVTGPVGDASVTVADSWNWPG